MKHWVSALSLFAACLASVTHALGFTLLETGEIKGTLKRADSPYLIKGKITVPYGERLVIEPGVLLGFYPVNPFTEPESRARELGRLVVEGSLQAVGTKEEPIVFTTTRDPEYPALMEPGASDQMLLPWGWIEVMGVPRKEVRGHIHYDPTWLTLEDRLAYHFASIGEMGPVVKHRPVDHGLDEEEAKETLRVAEEMGYMSGGHAAHGSQGGAPADSAEVSVPDTSSVMEHCIVRYSGYHWSVNVYNTMTIRNCTFSENISTPVGIFWGRPRILDSDIVGNHSHGIMILQGGSAVIERNRIIGNAGNGVDVHFASKTVIRDNLIRGHDAGINDASGTTVIEHNAIYDNAKGIESSRSFFFVSAQNNYWGHSTGPLDDEDDRAKGGDHNPEGQGNRIKGQIRYRPFLTSSPSDLDPDPDLGR